MLLLYTDISVTPRIWTFVGMGVPPVKIEVVTSIDCVNFTECFKNRLTIDLDGILVNYLALPDLLKNKKASARFKDLNDLEHLPEEWLFCL